MGRGAVRAVEDVQILQAGAGVEEDYGVFWFEESGWPEFAVGYQAGCAFGGGEDAFGFCPVARGFENFFVGGGDGCAFTFLQDVENQVVAVGFGDAQARGYSRRHSSTFLLIACLHPRL